MNSSVEKISTSSTTSRRRSLGVSEMKCCKTVIIILLTISSICEMHCFYCSQINRSYIVCVVVYRSIDCTRNVVCLCDLVYVWGRGLCLRFYEIKFRNATMYACTMNVCYVYTITDPKRYNAIMYVCWEDVCYVYAIIDPKRYNASMYVYWENACLCLCNCRPGRCNAKMYVYMYVRAYVYDFAESNATTH